MDEHAAEMLLVAAVPINCAAHANDDEAERQALRHLSRLLLEASETGRLGPELMALGLLADPQAPPPEPRPGLRFPHHGSRAQGQAR
jgi:hypothetical protein